MLEMGAILDKKPEAAVMPIPEENILALGVSTFNNSQNCCFSVYLHYDFQDTCLNLKPFHYPFRLLNSQTDLR